MPSLTNGVILNGELVAPELVDPRLHRFIGMFRPPVTDALIGYLMCRCGVVLSSTVEFGRHYRGGCFDYPQYVTIEKA